MYKISLANIARIKNRNNPAQTNKIKFSGGRSLDHPISTEMDVGAVAP